MRRLISNFMLLFLISPIVNGIDKIPDKTLLWNKFLEVEAFDRLLIALGENGIALFEPADSGSVFLEKSHVVLASPTKSMKFQDLIFVVRQLNDTLVFIDFHRTDSMNILGRLKPEFDYYDYAQTADRLFLSRWFDGIDMFRITYFQDMEFLEKFETGVVLTQLDLSGLFLRALDLYNGIVSHDLRNDYAPIVTKLLLEERPFAFTARGEDVIISTNDTGAIIGRMGFDSAYVVGLVPDVPAPKRVFFAGNYLAFVSDRGIDVRNDRTYAPVASAPISKERTTGSLSSAFGGTLMLLPKLESGVTGFRVPTLNINGEVLFRPGPVNSVLIAENHLFTGGGGNPLEAYEIESDSLLPPQLLRGEMTGLTDLAQNGNRLYALYADEKKVIVFDLTNVSGAPEIIDSFSISIENAVQLVASDSLLHVISRNQIEAHSEIFGEAVWNFEKPIVEVEVQNDLLYVTDRFGAIAAYYIQNDLSLTKCAERDLTGTGWAMTSYNNRLFVFSGSILTSFNECLELDTIVRLPVSVLDAEIYRDTLFTIGQGGIAKYDLAGGLTAYVDSGGLTGSQISVDAGVIATTDGGSVHLYFESVTADSGGSKQEKSAGVTLYENYPEPFNGSTTIQFDLSESKRVELAVFNLLGERVRLLANDVFSSGRHSIVWNGLGQKGEELASGVYFYRLSSEKETVSRKMLLLK